MTVPTQILVAGVRQKNAPIEIRERFAFSEDEIRRALPLLTNLRGIGECAMLSTCNRTEIYVSATDTERALQSIKQFFKDFKGLEVDDYRGALFVLLHEDAALHLFRVASGLDSLIIGEGQILGQVKDALAMAQDRGTAGQVLDKLFKTAITIGKRVRTETDIAMKDVSVSRAAYDFARRQEPALLAKRIAMVGGGKMATILLGALRRDMAPADYGHVVILNRSIERVRELADKFGFTGKTWECAPDVLREADVLFVATGAPHLVLGVEDFAGLGEKLVVDISVPRNVDPAVAALPNVRLYNTDDLAGCGARPADSQTALLAEARKIIDEEFSCFHHWLDSLSVIPTIARLKSKMEHLRQAELASAGAVAQPHFALVDEMSRNLVNKILHDPIVRLKNVRNRDDIHRHAKVLTHLFNIPPDLESLEGLESDRA